MRTKLKELIVFAASPGDVSSHREALREVIDELNRSVARDQGIVLSFKTWQDVPSGMGRPEQVILDEIGDFDIFIGIMGRRFGSPTGKYDGGTEEEFHGAYELWKKSKRPSILFYFNKELAPLPTTKKEVKQLAAVLNFRGSIEKLGLVKEYEGKDQLVQIVRKDLTAVLRKLRTATRGSIPISIRRKSPIQGDYWEIWRDAMFEGRVTGERVEGSIYSAARESVKFLTISGRSIYSGNVEEILSTKPINFCTKLLLFDWNSPQFPAKMRDERRNTDAMIELARQKANNIARQFLYLARSLKLNLEIKLYEDYPVWRILIADDAKAYLGYYAKGKRGYEGPMFVFNAVDNSTLFHPVSHYFNVLWQKAGSALNLDDPRLELLPLVDLDT